MLTSYNGCGKVSFIISYSITLFSCIWTRTTPIISELWITFSLWGPKEVKNMTRLKERLKLSLLCLSSRFVFSPLVFLFCFGPYICPVRRSAAVLWGFTKQIKRLIPTAASSGKTRKSCLPVSSEVGESIHCVPEQGRLPLLLIISWLRVGQSLITRMILHMTEYRYPGFSGEPWSQSSLLLQGAMTIIWLKLLIQKEMLLMAGGEKELCLSSARTWWKKVLLLLVVFYKYYNSLFYI